MKCVVFSTLDMILLSFLSVIPYFHFPSCDRQSLIGAMILPSSISFLSLSLSLAVSRARIHTDIETYLMIWLNAGKV